jgi:hypothetical protein
MPIDPLLTGSAIKLSYDAFRELLGYFGKAISRNKLDHQIEAAWRELLKGDASDDAIIEAALEAAKAAGNTTPDRLRLEQLFRNSKAHKKPESKKKPKRKPAPKRKRSTVKRAKHR